MRQPPPPLFASALVALQFFLQPNGASAAVPYPVAQPCFDSASASAKCDPSITAKFNACACSNTGNWLGLSAQCIGTTDASQLSVIYTTLQGNCAGTNNPIAFTLNQWLAAAGNSGSTPTAVTPATTAGTSNSVAPTVASTTIQISSVMSTTTSASVITLTQSGFVSVVTVGGAQATGPSASSSDKKLKAGAIAGIAIGVLCLVALAGGLFLIMRRRKGSDRSSRGSEIAYNHRDSSLFGGVPVVSKTPQSDATGFSDPVPQPAYHQGSFYSPEDVSSDPRQQVYSPQELQGSGPAPYGSNQQYAAPSPYPHTSELHGQPVSRTHDVRRYGYVA